MQSFSFVQVLSAFAQNVLISAMFLVSWSWFGHFIQQEVLPFIFSLHIVFTPKIKVSGLVMFHLSIVVGSYEYTTIVLYLVRKVQSWLSKLSRWIQTMWKLSSVILLATVWNLHHWGYGGALMLPTKNRGRHTFCNAPVWRETNIASTTNHNVTI